MKPQSVLIIAYSTLRQFPLSHLNSLSIAEKHVVICAPHDTCGRAWEPFPTLRKLKRSAIRALTRSQVAGRAKNYDTLSNTWATSKALRSFLAQKMNVQAEVARPGLLSILRRLPSSALWAWRMRHSLRKNLQGSPTPILLEGTEASGYILDSLINHARGFSINAETRITNLVISLYYLALWKSYFSWLASYLRQHRFDDLIINHNVYMESGWTAAHVRETYGTSVWLVGAVLPSPSNLENPRIIWAEWAAHKMMRSKALHHGPPPGLLSSPPEEPGWYADSALHALPRPEHLRINTKIYLIAMHAFTDASGLNYGYRKPIFSSYYHWIKETLYIAKSNSNAKYIFRIHPDTFTYYPRDYKLINALFTSLPPHVSVQDPRFDQQWDFERECPIVVTLNGSVALEIALIGLKAITISPPYAPPGTYITVSDLSSYKELLTAPPPPNGLLIPEALIEEARSWKAFLVSEFGNPLAAN
jgi:hypothetical protein